MTPILYAHPFSSYSQKVLIALYEAGTAFDYKVLTPDQPENYETLKRLWPPAQFPLLVDEDGPVMESTAIIERLHLTRPGAARMIPDDPFAAAEARRLDRVFDNHVMGPMQRIVFDALRPPERRDPVGVEENRAALRTIYAWLDGWMADREWAAAGAFSLADCAAAPALFYADWAEPIDAGHASLKAYRARLLARPSVARAVDEARPFRPFFPLGAPDRD